MIGQFALVLLVGLLAAGMLAPLSALTWWARKEPRAELAELEAARAIAREPLVDDDPHAAWVVYLTGVGAVDDVANPVGEQPMLDELAAALPDVGLVTDVYPYDVAGRGLVRGRGSAWFWRTVNRLGRSRWLKMAQALIYLRNVWQFAVSADDRYGPMYSLAMAQLVWDRLEAAGYSARARRPVVLLGWSGGAQMAVATATYLAVIGMPIYVVSVGGVLTSDPGLARVRHLWQLVGTRDHVVWFGRLFPGRWPGRRHSYWARAMAAGRITVDVIGNQQHLGHGSYLSRARTADGRSYREVSVDQIAARVRQVVAQNPR